MALRPESVSDTDSFRDMDLPHVFVLRGKLGELACDEILVPTDRDLLTHAGFESLVPLHPGSGEYRRAAVTADADWRNGTRRVQQIESDAGVGVRLVNTGGGPHTDLEWLLSGVAEALQEVSSAKRPPNRRRHRRLVTLPLFGTGAGGYAHRRGAVVAVLLELLQTHAVAGEIDIALVLSRSDDYAAVQAVRRRLPEEQPQSRWKSQAAELAARVAKRDVVLFAGAGLSVAAGLPDWWTLVRALANRAGLSPEVMTRLGELTPADAAQLIERKISRDAVRAFVVSELSETRYALGHGLLANLEVDEVLTTNYDALYERAYRAAGAPAGPLRVMPSETALPGQPWLLKMHGDIVGNDSIVLSRGDYLDYDAQHRPLASVAQALLMTRHMVFVGFSLVDDNFVRLAHDVQALMTRVSEPRPLGTVIALLPDPLRQSLWTGHLNFIVLDDAAAGEALDPAARLARNARRLEVFLDFIAMQAERESAYLLNADYADILNEDDRTLAEILDRVAHNFAERQLDGDAAQSVRELLMAMGWRPPRAEP